MLARYGDRSATEVATVDVSDPAAPEVTHTVDHDSALVTARLHDGVVRLVLAANLPDLDFTEPGDHTTEFEATHANRDAVRESTIEDWLPSSSLDGADAAPLLGCDQVAIPDDSTMLGTMAVVGFDASAPDAPSTTGLAVDTDLAYASADQLYLATSPSYGFVGDCFDCVDVLPAPRIPVAQPAAGLAHRRGRHRRRRRVLRPVPDAARRLRLRLRQPPLRLRPRRHRHDVRRIGPGGRRDPGPLVHGRRR